MAEQTLSRLHLAGRGFKVTPRPVAPVAQKAVTLDPALFWLRGSPSDPWRPDATEVAGRAAYALAHLAYVCIRYRATKVIEAPLMVVEETDDGEEWLPDHELNPLLERPNADYGMRRLIEATQVFLDTTGRCLWLKTRDGAKRVARLYPFSGDEFTVESGSRQLFERFRVQTSDGEKTFGPEDVVYFAYFDPRDPLGGLAPLDVCLSYLNIGQALKTRIRSMVKRTAAPGAIYVADKEWNPTDEEFARTKAEWNVAYAGLESGSSAILLGGGDLRFAGNTLADLQLGELYAEMEAACASAFGTPASVVGFKIGLENSPWSHLPTAVAQFYNDTILPQWAILEEPITQSLLREVDDDPAHRVRFDTSRVRALQEDLTAKSLEASNNARSWSLNERRVHTGQAPVSDALADVPPELFDLQLRERLMAEPPAPPTDGGDEPPEDGAPGSGEDVSDAGSAPAQDGNGNGNGNGNGKARAQVLAAFRAELGRPPGTRGSGGVPSKSGGAVGLLSPPGTKARHALVRAIHDAVIRSHETGWELRVGAELAHERMAVLDLAERTLRGTKAATDEDAAADPDRVRRLRDEVLRLLDGRAKREWPAVLRPLVEATGQEAIVQAANHLADAGVRFDLLIPGLPDYVQREAAFLVKSITDTTRQAIRDHLEAAVRAGESVGKIRQRLQALPAFDPQRAQLVARTEVTRVSNGAARESLSGYQQRSGTRLQKTWLNAGDDRVRDAHLDVSAGGVSGETRDLNEPFSNGLMEPSEPNCRCTLIYSVAEEAA